MWELLFGKPAQAAPAAATDSSGGFWNFLGTALNWTVFNPLALIVGGAYLMGFGDGFLPDSIKSDKARGAIGGLWDKMFGSGGDDGTKIKAITDLTAPNDKIKASELDLFKGLVDKLQQAGKLDGLKADLAAIGTIISQDGDQLAADGTKADIAKQLTAIAAKIKPADGAAKDDNVDAAIAFVNAKVRELGPSRR